MIINTIICIKKYNERFDKMFHSVVFYFDKADKIYTIRDTNE